MSRSQPIGSARLSEADAAGEDSRQRRGAGRSRFDRAELMEVLRHYDLGRISDIREFPRGSRRSPKVRITSSRGQFLLKRRAPGRDDPQRVAFTHGLQSHLARRRFPVAGLLRTRAHGSTMVRWGSRIYEMFRFVEGVSYDHSAPATLSAGLVLGRMHRLLVDHPVPSEPPIGSFHAAAGIEARLGELAPAVSAVERGVDQAALAETAASLLQSYASAAARVDAIGYRQWPAIVIHGDWHPGNLIFREGDIAAVLDFDSSRVEPRLADVANGALQFAMRIGRPEEPASWPEGLDLERVAAVVRGYDEGSQRPLSPAERDALPWLIVQALIVESVVPIAATGSFARISGSVFLAMVRRKVRWIRTQAEQLARCGEG